MKGFDRQDLLFSLCGLNCVLCPMRLGGHCPGCGGGKGNQSCGIARCSLEHGGPEYCSECGEFPCGRYEGFEETDSFITHRHCRKDFEKRQRIGTEKYREEQEKKRRILQLFLENYNDGRRKTFFCVAVNLLELEDLERAVRQLGAEKEADSLPMKEKAARAVCLLQAAADERKIALRLRKAKDRTAE